MKKIILILFIVLAAGGWSGGTYGSRIEARKASQKWQKADPNNRVCHLSSDYREKQFNCFQKDSDEQNYDDPKYFYFKWGSQ